MNPISGFFPRAISPPGGRRTVRDDLSCLDSLSLVNDRSLIVAVALVASLELRQLIGLLCSRRRV